MRQAFKDHDDKLSITRIVWTIAVLTVVMTWALVSLENNELCQWPLDGVSTVALFGATSVKSFADRRSSSPKSKPPDI